MMEKKNHLSEHIEQSYEIGELDKTMTSKIKWVNNLDKKNVSIETANEKDIKNEYVRLRYAQKNIHDATEILAKFIIKHNKFYTINNDLKNEIWIYDEGVYVPNGINAIKKMTRKVIEEFYNEPSAKQIIAKIASDTLIDADKFFSVKYPNEIPVLNGILNIKTRKLQSFTPEKIFFNKIQAKYDPNALCPRIDAFFSDILKEEHDKNILYEIVGFALLSDYRFEKAFMFLGDGRNGKSKCLDLLRRLFPDVCSLPLQSLQSDSFSISELFGKRLNLAGDIGNKNLKETEMFKSLVGRDLITAKRKFLPDLKFENNAKFVFSCNELPIVYDISKGFWDRWGALLLFPYTFIPLEEYKSLKDKGFYKVRDESIIEKISSPQELSGLLNKALDALDRLLATGKFSENKTCDEIKELWMIKSNSVMSFCNQFIENESDGHIIKRNFKQEYIKYCKKHKVRVKSDKVIKNTLEEIYGASDEQITTPQHQYQVWAWTGIKFKTNFTGKLT